MEDMSVKVRNYKKKKYFAQTNDSDPLRHKAKYFHTLEEANEFIQSNGGGSIKIRGKDAWHLGVCK